MGMTAFELFGVLKLDKSDFESGLRIAERESSLLGSALGTVAKVGISAMAAAGTAVLGFGASSVVAGSQFDAAMGGVAATMGTTIDGMEADVGEVDTAFGHFSGTLRDFAIYMGQNTVFSATQSAEALNYMALAGYNAQESMNMLPAVLDMAAAGSMDLARASDMITDTQSALGLSFERTQYMVNEFAKAASTGNTSVEQLGEAFLRVGGLAKETNGGFVTLADGTQQAVDNVTEMEIAFTAMANAGVKGSEAGTHMRNMLMKLTGPTDDGAKALEAMGVSVFDTEGKMRSLKDIFGELNVAMGQMTQQDKLKVIQDLFNARDLASAEALLGAVEQDWDAIGESILQADGAASQMAETKLDNLQGDMVKFNSALEAVQIAINDDVSPTLREFVQFGTQGMQTFKEAFDAGGLDAAIQSIGPILAQGLTLIVSKIPSIVKAANGLLKGFLEGLVGAAPEIMQTIGTLLKQSWTMITTGLPTFTAKAVEIMHALAQGIRDNLPQMIEEGINALTEFSGSLIDNVGLLLGAGLDIMLALVEGLIQALPSLIEALPTIIENLVNGIIELLPKIIEVAIQLIGALVQGIIENLPLIIAAAIEIVFALVNGLIEALPDLLTAGYNLVTELLGRIIESIPKMQEGGVKIVLAIIEGIVSHFGTLMETGIKLVTNIIDAVVGRFERLREAGRNVVTAVKDGFKQKVEDAKKWGQDMIQNFIDGILAKWEALKQTVSNVAQSVKDFIGFSEPDVGPLSDFHTYAPDMMDLFMQGIKDNQKALATTVANAFDFKDSITAPELTNGRFDLSKSNLDLSELSGNTYNITFNQPVDSAVDVARAIREEAQYGLLGGGYAY